jgi:hypothetical protein
MCHLSNVLDIQLLRTWNAGFEPTILGRPWGGVGAYNSNTQKNKDGLLANDPDDVAKRATGPNEYVTRRWRSRMKPYEIEIVEQLMAGEMSTFGYERVTPPLRGEEPRPLWLAFILPLSGELPTLSWILKGRSLRDICDRTFYLFVFPIFFIVSRISFISFVKRSRVFS